MSTETKQFIVRNRTRILVGMFIAFMLFRIFIVKA